VRTSPIGVKKIAAREGTILHVYKDSKGLPTAGVGHLITAAEKKDYPVGRHITQAESDAWLAADLKECEDAVNALDVKLKQNEFDALVSLAFNIGVGAASGPHKGGFLGSTVVRRLKAGDKPGAAKAILLWNKPPEIQGRRRTEYNQFLTPYKDSAAVQTAENLPLNAVNIANPGASGVVLNSASENATDAQPPNTATSQPTEQTVTEQVDDSTIVQTTTAAPVQNVVIEKRKEEGWLSLKWKQITGLFTGNAILDGLTDRFKEFQAFGLSAEFWQRVVYLALAATVIYLVVDWWKHRSKIKEEIARDAVLAKENSQPGNFVQFAPTEYLQEYRARGYKVITR